MGEDCKNRTRSPCIPFNLSSTQSGATLLYRSQPLFPELQSALLSYAYDNDLSKIVLALLFHFSFSIIVQIRAIFMLYKNALI